MTKCPYEGCKNTFKSDLSAIRHVGLVHGPNAPWRKRGGLQCPHCEVLFRGQGPMREHIRADHGITDTMKMKLPSNAEFREFNANPNGSNGHAKPVVRLQQSIEPPRSDAYKAVQAIVRAVSGRLSLEGNALLHASEVVKDTFKSLEKEL